MVTFLYMVSQNAITSVPIYLQSRRLHFYKSRLHSSLTYSIPHKLYTSSHTRELTRGTTHHKNKLCQNYFAQKSFIVQQHTDRLSGRAKMETPSRRRKRYGRHLRKIFPRLNTVTSNHACSTLTNRNCRPQANNPVHQLHYQLSPTIMRPMLSVPIMLLFIPKSYPDLLHNRSPLSSPLSPGTSTSPYSEFSPHRARGSSPQKSTTPSLPAVLGRTVAVAKRHSITTSGVGGSARGEARLPPRPAGAHEQTATAACSAFGGIW